MSKDGLGRWWSSMVSRVIVTYPDETFDVIDRLLVARPASAGRLPPSRLAPTTTLTTPGTRHGFAARPRGFSGSTWRWPSPHVPRSLLRVVRCQRFAGGWRDLHRTAPASATLCRSPGALE